MAGDHENPWSIKIVEAETRADNNSRNEVRAFKPKYYCSIATTSISIAC